MMGNFKNGPLFKKALEANKDHTKNYIFVLAFDDL